MQKSKTAMQAKDLITTGIFTALLMIVITIFAMLMSGLPVVSLFTTCVEAVICGVIFMYVAAKIQKFGAITIMGILVGLFFFLVGHFWLCIVWMPLFAVAGDYMCSRGGYKSFRLTTIGYSLFCLGLTLCAYNPMLFFADDFISSRTQMGMTAEYIQQTIDLTHGPLMVVVFVLTVVCAIIGALIGKGLLKKHFMKAGVM